MTETWARQLRILGNSWSTTSTTRNAPENTLPNWSPQLRVPNDDVFVIFLESYGAVALRRPELTAGTRASRLGLQNAIQRSGRGVVSAYLASPTFGSGSWLAHASLLTGVSVRDGDEYAQLLLRKRRTLGDVFRNGGYRALALMPGLRQSWPEGEFFGFDRIYDAKALDYRGPEFGWWRIPDQYSLSQFDRLEAARSSAKGTVPPRFILFPTISSHMPFRPTPPYQPDWARMTTSSPYGAEAAAAIARGPEWTNLGPSYADSLAYAQRSIAGYLEQHRGRPLLMVILGDHQPPAAVSGEGASWDVPVHVIADRRAPLEALLRHGFVAGLAPVGAARGGMHELGGWLIDALQRPSTEDRAERTTEHSGLGQRDEQQPGDGASKVGVVVDTTDRIARRVVGVGEVAKRE